MGVVTYEHISISGFEYERILGLRIEHNINTHSKADIVCEVTGQQGMETLSALKTDDYVMVSYTADAGAGVLFYGVCQSKELVFAGEYYKLHIILASTSILLDKKKENKTFQNSQQYISDIMGAVVKGRAIINFHMTDKPVGELVVQHEETAWECVKRLASHCNARVIANITTQVPVIDIGKNPEEEAGEKPLELLWPKDAPQRKIDEALMRPVEISPWDITAFNSWSGTIEMKDGVLTKTTYRLKDSDYLQERTYNSQISGLILTGIVKDVDRNMVKVFFDQIDERYDAATNKWFEYTTAYAGNGGEYGSGIYFMPEVGDRVRVFFPNENEDCGVAFASEIVSPLASERMMNWKSPGGQEILFTEYGIQITGKKDSVFIQLIEDENNDAGIYIVCDKNISILSESDDSTSDNAIVLKAERDVMIYADQQIKLETNSDILEIDKGKICFQTENLYLMDD